MSLLKNSALMTASVLAVGLGMATPAHAILRVQLQHAAGLCQGALPVYDTSLRNRPKAISNEGTSGAYVSCSWQGDNGGSSTPPIALGAYFVNHTSVNQNVNCTFVDGTPYETPLVYFPKAVVVPPVSLNYIVWDPATDNGGVNFSPFNDMSCNLPAGVEMTLLFRHVEDGSA